MACNIKYKNSVMNNGWDFEYWHVKWEGIGDMCRAMERNVDLCCVQEVTLRGCGARLIGLQGREYKLWWSGNQEGYGGIGVVVKQEMYDEVTEVRRVNDRATSIDIVFDEVLRVVCAYAPRSGKSMEEKECFYEDLSREIYQVYIKTVFFFWP